MTSYFQDMNMHTSCMPCWPPTCTGCMHALVTYIVNHGFIALAGSAINWAVAGYSAHSLWILLVCSLFILVKS